MLLKRWSLKGSNPNVCKYVFEDTQDPAIVETVAYKYPDFKTRTVICCSVMSGCPVGCKFCGTGKHFVRNLNAYEIAHQVNSCVFDIELAEQGFDMNRDCEKFQIMFMSMGEPMLNHEIFEAIKILHDTYPKAQLLVSTVGVRDDEWMFEFLRLAKEIPQIGLQLSIHESMECSRNELIPYKSKYSLQELRDWGMMFYMDTGRRVFLNYCVTNKNNGINDVIDLRNLFSPIAFAFTFSVVCNPKQGELSEQDLDMIRLFQSHFPEYNTRIFNPAGQDDIGGGCGQLWFVQDWLKKHKDSGKDGNSSVC